ncbi:hypothetical protein F6A13_03625 [Acidithiobacillus sp. 'AMD consortium']|uniref:hypothetical protein n=1 Tax=Acidithiobacillus sp. 'AMD consortium' TaxID=2614801 RepID=UPI00124EBD47|nr:hypothetical protein [Acidithiobacillus sp. 'AMD consortium']QFG77825.1 hypothetical protein F6A13_03625 [Acidithiobacillus sp. 'AMD consortium']
MNKNNFEAQLAANLVAAEIRRTGINQAARLAQLKQVINRVEFTPTDLTEVLDPNWKSPEQIQAEKEAEEAAAKRKAA